MATRSSGKKYQPDIRSDARSASVLVRMSPLERRLLHQAARDRGSTVQQLVMTALLPTLTAALHQEQLDLGLEDRRLIEAHS